jgi:hypothetical protein
MPDFNPDKERHNKHKFVVQQAWPDVVGGDVATTRGNLRPDKQGRMVVKDESLAREIQQEHPRDLTVTRMTSNDPADVGHRYLFGQMPEMPWKGRARLERELQEFEEGYAKRSGVTVEWLHSRGQFGAPCDCGEDGCSGWQMTSRRIWDTEPTEGGETAQAETPAEAQETTEEHDEE